MRMRIIRDTMPFADELRLRDPDAFMLLELYHFDHGERVFEWDSEARRDMQREMPGGAWSEDRFDGALGRLIKKGFLVGVAEPIQ